MKPDMSPQAIAVRLRRVSQLRRLCLSPGKAKPKSNPPTSKNSHPHHLQNRKDML